MKQEYNHDGCTIVSWFYRKFLNRSVPWLDACIEHDIDYITHRVSRWQSDVKFFKNLWRNGHKIAAVVQIPFIVLFGWVWYYT